jgi:hypothetical protein
MKIFAYFFSGISFPYFIFSMRENSVYSYLPHLKLCFKRIIYHSFGEDVSISCFQHTFTKYTTLFLEGYKQRGHFRY